ncbi:MAG: PKD domain-containing protein, partial [Thiotrichaceae bacterium]|nr:PKD domain-containing protein [Thiotrichaceae bacterium]
SAAYDINDLNQVVGQSRLITANTSLNDPTKYHAFIWQDGQMDDLNNLAGLPDGWLLTRANAINENGDIAGVGIFNGVEHGFVLTSGTIAEPPPAENQAPIAIASADVYSGKASLMVNFDGSASTDPDGTIATYSWDFMDGNFSNEMSPSHEFTNTGTYVVTLTITDNLGMESSTSISIIVRKGGKK